MNEHFLKQILSRKQTRESNDDSLLYVKKWEDSMWRNWEFYKKRTIHATKLDFKECQGSGLSVSYDFLN